MNSVVPQCSIWTDGALTETTNQNLENRHLYQSNSTTFHKVVSIDNTFIKASPGQVSQSAAQNVSVKNSLSVASKVSRYLTPKSPLCRGLIMGGLLACIALAAVIALWLTASKTTTTAAATTTLTPTFYEIVTTTTTEEVVAEADNF